LNHIRKRRGAALTRLREIAEKESRHDGWKSAAFSFYGDAALILNLLEALEAKREKASAWERIAAVLWKP
jgi:hypothetical protein